MCTMIWYVLKAKNTLVKYVYYIMELTIFSFVILFEDWDKKCDRVNIFKWILQWKKFPRDKIIDTATQKFNDLLESVFERSNAVRQLHPSISSVEEGSRAAFPLGFGHATRYVGKGVVLIG